MNTVQIPMSNIFEPDHVALGCISRKVIWKFLSSTLFSATEAWFTRKEEYYTKKSRITSILTIMPLVKLIYESYSLLES